MRNRTLSTILIFFSFFFLKTGYCKCTFKTDTIVGSKNITNEYAGGAYRKRGKEYFVIIDKDTSDFRCFFSESKADNTIDLDIGNHKLKPEKKTDYEQRLKELKAIIPIAANDFNLKLIRYIWIGRLVSFGDLAVEITKEYHNEFGLESQNINYKKVAPFLMHSKLSTDLNKIFKPYSVIVSNVSYEHVFFTTKKDLYWNSKMASDPKQVPEKIFDCMIWIQLKPAK
jgi:hypothetical protein